MAKIVCHLTSQWNVPSPRDCQNASSEVVTRRSTPVACHNVWAKGQMKNKCWQSSTALAHNRHSTGASDTIRCSRDHVISRRRSRSQANTLIFRGRLRFHTKRHLCRMSGSSEFSWSRSSLYAARVMKLGLLHTHASCAATDRRRSAKSSLMRSPLRNRGQGWTRRRGVRVGISEKERKRTYRRVELCLSTLHGLSGCLLGNSSGVPDNTPVSLSPILARSR